MGRGLFISLEGGEGSGKTTQIRHLRDSLSDSGWDVVLTREPGGTPESEKIRDLLVQRDGGDWSAEAETLLFFAARHMHCQKLIWPALDAGKVVICDRFTDSTRAYQSYAGKLGQDFIDGLVDNVLGGFEPDLTLILDIDPKAGLLRSASQNEGSDARESTEDRFELKGLAFHQKIRDGFLDIAELNSERCRVIDADRSVEEIQVDVTAYTQEILDRRDA